MRGEGRWGEELETVRDLLFASGVQRTRVRSGENGRVVEINGKSR